MNKLKNTKGITLISLIITIIILVILAGASINLMIGQDGSINNVKNAEEKYEEQQNTRQETLNELKTEFENYNKNLPQNTQDNPQDIGTEVSLKDEWTIESINYIKTGNGEEITDLTKIATVYAISVGGGETIPVPKGFYYVGGNLNTGVIISDNVEDKYEEGIDKTTYQYATNLKGNQFVWIPCSASEYKKTDWGKQNSKWDTTTPKSELSQIEKYGGFYVARYEAGIATNMTNFTTNQIHTGSVSIYNLSGIPQSKAGIIPWIFIDWTHSKSNAENMYNNQYVSSGLITGTQWDVILNKLIDKAGLTRSDIVTLSSWGNYRDTSITYNGMLSITDYNVTNSGNWTIKPFSAVTTGTTTSYENDNTYGDLLSTGASATTEKYHIFDLAGNLWEWTEENSTTSSDGQYRICRGRELPLFSLSSSCLLSRWSYYNR